ncbi:50S ribosomal protein L3 N(5)-glutamine methyltransferase [Thiotrichales bacterium HSG1]|nr:50S ribosomal protein L3 N(5)-glutamine methyltransferase [Thiotrichales bacterium HSG1]
MKELQTIGDFIRWGASQFNQANLFFGHGTDNAVDEATTLVVYALHLPQELPDILWHSKLTYPEKQKIIEFFNIRIAKNIPSPYITKEAWFTNLSFYVNQHVLIPRSPIAELIEQRFEPWMDYSNSIKMLDLCTGSGCIAIASSILAFPNTVIDATDISYDALDVAKKNVSTYGLEQKINLIQSNLFSNLGNKLYNLIVSNPPYVDVEELKNMPLEYTHEPKIGLAAGTDGLFFVEQILRHATKHLTSDGILIVEVGLSQTNLIKRYPDVPFTWLKFQRGGEGVFLLTYEQLCHLNQVEV